jgi:hypothetical protein
MTTSVCSEISRDLARNPGWPLFSRHGAVVSGATPLAALTVTWKCSDRDLDALLRTAATGLEHRIEKLAGTLGHVVQVLLVNLTLQPRSAAVLHRKIWRSTQVGVVPPGVTCGSEAIIDCAERVRFASVGTVPISALPWMLSVIRTFDIVVPLILRAPSPMENEIALALAKAAFPPDGCQQHSDFDWPALTERIASAGGVCLRRVENLADGEISVDFFSADGAVNLLADTIGDDDDLTKEN